MDFFLQQEKCLVMANCKEFALRFCNFVVMISILFVSTGVGLCLRAQFLPPVFGCVYCTFAAKEEPLCRNGAQCSQTQLLHALLLCMKSLYDDTNFL